MGAAAPLVVGEGFQREPPRNRFPLAVFFCPFLWASKERGPPEATGSGRSLAETSGESAEVPIIARCGGNGSDRHNIQRIIVQTGTVPLDTVYLPISMIINDTNVTNVMGM